METLDTMAAIVWLAVGTSVVALIGRLIQRGSALLLAQENRIRNADARDALEFATMEATRAVRTIVGSLNQTAVAELKAQGKWDATAAKAVKAQALSQLRSALSSEGRALLEHAVGDFGRYLDALLEAEVASAKGTAPTRAASSHAALRFANDRPTNPFQD